VSREQATACYRPYSFLGKSVVVFFGVKQRRLQTV
jgi:hypothetical protein